MSTVGDTGTRRLPRGRHPLTREQVEQDQRLRILLAVADTMATQGYVNTSVADVISSAGVSRATFYQQFDDKLDAFMAAFDLVGELLLGSLAAVSAADGSPLERVERAMAVYLETIAMEPRYARLFLIEVHAAGPAAIERRHGIQSRIVDELADLIGARTDAGRFACQVVVTSVSAMVVGPIVDGDSAAVLALGPPMIDHIRRLFEAWIFTD